MDNNQSGGLYSLPPLRSSWLPKSRLFEDLSDEEVIEEEIEELSDIMDEDSTKVNAGNVEKDMEEDELPADSMDDDYMEKNRQLYGNVEKDMEEDESSSDNMEDDFMGKVLQLCETFEGDAVEEVDMEEDSKKEILRLCSNVEDVETSSDYMEEDLMEKVQKPADEIEEEIKGMQEFAHEDAEKEIVEEVQEQNRQDRAALEEALKEDKGTKAQLQEALKQEQKEKDALALENEFLKTQVFQLKKSRNEQDRRKEKLKARISKVTSELEEQKKENQQSTDQLRDTITNMSAEVEEDKEVIKKLRNDLTGSTFHHEKEMAEYEKVVYADIRAHKDRIDELQQGSLEKDEIIQSLQLNMDNLLRDIEAKENIASSLQEEGNQWASDLIEERNKNCSLQRDYEAAVSLQRKDSGELQHLTQKYQQLTSENSRLKGELAAVLTKQQADHNQVQQDQDTCSRLEEAVRKEKARFSRAYKKIQALEKELFEKTLALEKSLTLEKFLKSSLKSEQKRFEHMALGKQAAAEPLTLLTNQLREVSVSKEHLLYDMQTLRMENADIRAKLSVREKEYENVRSKHCSLSECHAEMMSEKNNIISDNKVTITELQCLVDEFRGQLSGSKARQAEAEDALKQDRARNSELQQRVDQLASALENERTRRANQQVELKDALTKQVEVLEEKQKLALALQKAQDSCSRLEERQLAESDFQLRHTSDTELRLYQQKAALDESTRALHHLQQEYTDLGGRHSSINTEYCELLKTHTALQIRYERLSYVQGNPRPDFSPALFTVNL